MVNVTKYSLEKLAQNPKLLESANLSGLRSVEEACQQFLQVRDKIKKASPRSWDNTKEAKDMEREVLKVSKLVTRLIGKKNLKKQQEEK